MRNGEQNSRSSSSDSPFPHQRHRHRNRNRQVGTWTGTVTTSGGWERRQKDDVDGLVPLPTWVPGLAWPAFGGGGGGCTSHSNSSWIWAAVCCQQPGSTKVTRDKGRVGQPSVEYNLLCSAVQCRKGDTGRTKCSVTHPPRLFRFYLCCRQIGERAVPWKPCLPGYVTVLVG